MRKAPLTTPEVVSGDCQDFGAFGYLPVERDRAIMLEIRHATGDITALSYALLESAKFNPSNGIELNFSGTSVILVGRNLNEPVTYGVRFFEALIRHRVLWIQEANEGHEQETDESDVVIEQVRLISAQGN